MMTLRLGEIRQRGGFSNRPWFQKLQAFFGASPVADVLGSACEFSVIDAEEFGGLRFVAA
jgi:hypothetical protein